MKFISILILCAMLFTGLVGCTGNTDNDQPELKETELRFERDGITYYNVSVAALTKDPNFSMDDSLFPEGEEGYYIESGTYLLSVKGWYRVIGKPFLGDGAIKYHQWNRVNYTEDDIHVFDGVLPISKMNDPLYVAMCSPTEGKNYTTEYHKHRNGDTYVPAYEKHTNVLPIAAIYLSSDCDLPDDTKITLCVGKMYCAVKYTDGEWFSAYSALPEAPCNMYPLPWQLEFGDDYVKNRVIPDRLIKDCGDYYEITLKVGDFRRKTNEDERLVGRVLHFWGNSRYYYKGGHTGADVEGIAASYEVWVKEPEYEGVLLADVGVDQRDAYGNVDQSFNSKAYNITSEKRIIVGHNVCPLCYDTVMDTEKVQELLGMK